MLLSHCIVTQFEKLEKIHKKKRAMELVKINLDRFCEVGYLFRCIFYVNKCFCWFILVKNLKGYT